MTNAITSMFYGVTATGFNNGGSLTTTVKGGYIEFCKKGIIAHGRHWPDNEPYRKELKRREMYQRRYARRNA